MRLIVRAFAPCSFWGRVGKFLPTLVFQIVVELAQLLVRLSLESVVAGVRDEVFLGGEQLDQDVLVLFDDVFHEDVRVSHELFGDAAVVALEARGVLEDLRRVGVAEELVEEAQDTRFLDRSVIPDPADFAGDVLAGREFAAGGGREQFGVRPLVGERVGDRVCQVGSAQHSPPVLVLLPDTELGAVDRLRADGDRE